VPYGVVHSGEVVLMLIKIGRNGNGKIIAEYVKNQEKEKEYEVLHKDSQLN